MSKDLFKQAWVTNGAGAFENKTLAQANTENKKILEALNCGSDEVKFFENRFFLNVAKKKFKKSNFFLKLDKLEY